MVFALLSCFALVACGESGPTDEEVKVAEDERKSARKLAKEAESATAVAVNCRSDLGPLIQSLRNTGSRLNVGLVFADYSTQVGQISVAYDRIPFNRMDYECISTVGIQAEKAFGAYTDAYNEWNDCIGDLYCDMDSIDSELQDKWRKAGRQVNQARQGLVTLETIAVEAQEKADKQKRKAKEAEAALDS
ncbi:MAG: hypothetical protein QG596_2172 [Actinomycetota bacterium]|nr:hypothetical protein [Actinomycetota bacterium]